MCVCARARACVRACCCCCCGADAYLGTGWVGCVGEGASRHSNETYVRPALFDADYGVPTATSAARGRGATLCAEVEGQPGLFRREYTKAIVTFDCRTNQSSITMK